MGKLTSQVEVNKLFYTYLGHWNNTIPDYSMDEYPTSLIFHPESKRIIQNGVVYGGNSTIYYIEGSANDADGSWTGTLYDIDSYYDGLTIIYEPKVDGSSSTTLNINSLGAIPCYYDDTNRLTTQYKIGCPMMLTYKDGVFIRSDYMPDISGNASSLDVQEANGATSYYVTMSNVASGTSYTYVSSSMYYDNNLSRLHVPHVVSSSFIGDLVGDVTGDVVGYVTGSISGNAQTASQLQSSTYLWGQQFDGSSSIDGDIEDTGGILPKETTTYNIGSMSLQYNNIYAKYFKGRADTTASSMANTTSFFFVGIESANGELKYDQNIRTSTISGSLSINYLNINTSSFNDQYRMYVNGASNIAGNLTATKFIKNNLTNGDNYVLLAGGGHKPLTDFVTSASGHTHSMLDMRDMENVLKAPNAADFPVMTMSTFINTAGMPTADEYGGINVRSEDDTNSTWQLAGCTKQADYNGHLFLRYGRGSTWNAWKTLLDSDNISDYLGYIGTTQVSSASSPGQTVEGIGSILPSEAFTYNIGSASLAFNNMYAKTLVAPVSSALSLGANGESVIMINSSENVGIGTSSPSTKLTVAGKATIQNINEDALALRRSSVGSIAMELYNDNQSTYKWSIGMESGATGSLAFAFGTLSSANVKINTSGQIVSLTSGATTPPFVIGSTAMVENLNADMLDGKHASDFAIATTAGNTVTPIYSNAGTLEAITATIGSSSQPVYFDNGAITALTDSIGTSAKPVYLSGGTITSCSASVGSSAIPTYMYQGVISQVTPSEMFSSFTINSSEELSLTIAGQTRTVSGSFNTVLSYDKSLRPTTEWADTGIDSSTTYFPNGDGTYIVQVYCPANDATDLYPSIYSGVMSMYNGTSSTDEEQSDEIILHRAGKSSSKRIYLKTMPTASSIGTMKIQIASDTNYSSAKTFTFKFKKMI